MKTSTLDMRVFCDNAKDFSSVKNSNVLFYWPHGLGDFVFLSAILPFLDSSNHYFIARYGDNNTSLFEGCNYITALYVGVDTASCDDGLHFKNKHFGLSDANNNSIFRLNLPNSLYSTCKQSKIDTIVYIPFWESHGYEPYPFHTKGRKCLKHLTSLDLLKNPALEKALPSTINFNAPVFVNKWVESRLRSLAGWSGKKLCLITRNGYTSVGKNWGHLWRNEMPEGKQREGEECRDFIRLLHARDPAWVFVVFEDRVFIGDDTVTDARLNCFSFAELFSGTPGGPLPFSLVLKALLSIADIAIGVPSGPTHLAMAKPGLPTIGIWTEHYPSWYDEPKSESIHILSKNIWASNAVNRPGSFSNHKSLNYEMIHADTCIIPGETVLCAFDHLLR